MEAQASFCEGLRGLEEFIGRAGELLGARGGEPFAALRKYILYFVIFGWWPIFKFGSFNFVRCGRRQKELVKFAIVTPLVRVSIDNWRRGLRPGCLSPR
jgi:hypothetical protein